MVKVHRKQIPPMSDLSLGTVRRLIIYMPARTLPGVVKYLALRTPPEALSEQ
jgi:hypothetical protein